MISPESESSLNNPSHELSEKDRETLLLADIFDQGRKLLALLQIQREPNGRDDDIYFDIDRSNILVPPSIAAALDGRTKLTDLSVSVGLSESTEETNESLISFQFGGVAIDGTKIIIDSSLISSDGKSDAVNIEILVGEDVDTLPLTQCSIAEINQMLASIYQPNKLGDYRAFESLDLNDPRIVGNLNEALKKHAVEYNERILFAIESPFADRPHEIEFTDNMDSAAETISIRRAIGSGNYEEYMLHFSPSINDMIEFDTPPNGFDYHLPDDKTPDLQEVLEFVNDLVGRFGHDYSEEAFFLDWSQITDKTDIGSVASRQDSREMLNASPDDIDDDFTTDDQDYT